MSRLISTEPTDYRTETDRDYPDFTSKVRPVLALVEPPLSPTETDQCIERWGAFLRGNSVVLEREAMGLFNGILKLRTEKDPDVLNVDPPALYLRTRNVLDVKTWLDAGAKTATEIATRPPARHTEDGTPACAAALDQWVKGAQAFNGQVGD